MDYFERDLIEPTFEQFTRSVCQKPCRRHIRGRKWGLYGRVSPGISANGNEIVDIPFTSYSFNSVNYYFFFVPSFG